MPKQIDIEKAKKLFIPNEITSMDEVEDAIIKYDELGQHLHKVISEYREKEKLKDQKLNELQKLLPKKEETKS